RKLVHLTSPEIIPKLSSQLGKGGSTVYAATESISQYSMPIRFLRTGIGSVEKLKGVKEIPTYASGAFRKPVVIGPFSTWQRASGARFTPGAGFVNLKTGRFVRKGPSLNQTSFYAADAFIVGATRLRYSPIRNTNTSSERKRAPQ
ncbi:MAG: hypothetical protein JAZ15_19940, partial [Candidatus Thiodiazotropha endolucinida]|nr:hypothetical protein [Candidatus Thiodiazotropha taylori]MCW4315292.1 hypothetical protein [Candidatus Thiodiazotropha taylori]